MASWGRCRRCGGRIWWGTSPFSTGRAFPFDDDQEQQSHFGTCSAQEWVTDSQGGRHSVSTCRACNAKVWWDTTHSGKRRPMDVEGTAATWTCHLDTCVGVAPGAGGEEYDAAWARQQQAQVLAIPSELWLSELGLSWPCTLAEATRAFRRLALTHHPDMGGNVSDFVRIRLAYDRLKELLAQEVEA